MVVICLGPVCLPLWPLVALTVKPLWDRVVPETCKIALLKWWTAIAAFFCPSRTPQSSKAIKKNDDIQSLVKHIDSRADFETAMKQSNIHPIVIKFTADFCGPCKLIAPVFQQQAERFQGKMSFYELDIENLDSVALELGVASIPAFHVIRSEKKVDELVGANIDKLEAIIKKHGSSQKRNA